MSSATDVRIVPFRPELAAAFVRLNLEWIERFFQVEESDTRMFSDCKRAIVDSGGQIFFAVAGDEVVGTCAIIRHGPDTYELAKMAVTPAAQGKGAGRRLAEAAITFAEAAGARTVTLLTNRQLDSAIRLYERLGFEYAPCASSSEYARADVYMELSLPRDAT